MLVSYLNMFPHVAELTNFYRSILRYFERQKNPKLKAADDAQTVRKDRQGRIIGPNGCPALNKDWGCCADEGSNDSSRWVGVQRLYRGVLLSIRDGRRTRRNDGVGENDFYYRTMGQIRRKHRINSRLIIHCPTSEGVSEVSERANE